MRLTKISCLLVVTGFLNLSVERPKSERPIQNKPEQPVAAKATVAKQHWNSIQAYPFSRQTVLSLIAKKHKTIPERLDLNLPEASKKVYGWQAVCRLEQLKDKQEKGFVFVEFYRLDPKAPWGVTTTNDKNIDIEKELLCDLFNYPGLTLYPKYSPGIVEPTLQKNRLTIFDACNSKEQEADRAEAIVNTRDLKNRVHRWAALSKQKPSLTATFPMSSSSALTFLQKKYNVDSADELDLKIPEVSDINRAETWRAIWKPGNTSPEGKILVDFYLDTTYDCPHPADYLGESGTDRVQKLYILKNLLDLPDLDQEPLRQMVLQMIIFDLIINPWREGKLRESQAACLMRYYIDSGYTRTDFGLSEAEAIRLALKFGQPRDCCEESAKPCDK